VAVTEKNQIEEKTPFRVRSLFYMLGAVLFALAVFSHSAGDYAVLAGGVTGVVGNWIGNIGARISCGLFLTIGLGAYVLAVIVLLAAFRSFMTQKLSRTWLFLPGVLLTVLGSAVLFAFDPVAFAGTCENLGLGRCEVPELSLSGGVLGQVLVAPGVSADTAGVLRQYLGPVGSTLLSSTLLLAGLIMLYRSDWHSVLVSWVDSLCAEPAEKSPAAPQRKGSGRGEPGFVERVKKLMEKTQSISEVPEETAPAAAPAAAPDIPVQDELPAVSAAEPVSGSVPDEAMAMEPDPTAEDAEVEVLPPPSAVAAAARQNVQENTPAAAPEFGAGRSTAMVGGAGSAIQTAAAGDLAKPTVIEAGEKAVKVNCADFALPKFTMLSKGSEVAGEKPEVIAQNKTILQTVLDSFKVAGQVVGHVSGPRVTRYEISLAPSVNVNKLSALEKNIAMNLGAPSVRILTPIPGKTVCGVEVPNSKAEAITMRSIMETEAWTASRMEIPLVLGKDVSGNPVVLDLAQAPHLMIAGATGSGKSVCMNTLIMSLLMKFSPDDLKLILVDPKVVEMADYQSLPHLITPVIDDFKKVPLALRWAAMEMDKRYKMLAKAGVRKLKDYNSRRLPEVPVLDDDGVPIPDKLPVLIVIIDELADLMQTDARSDIETSISRIAAKGRAAGVHIVVATQRPSRDVITGTIKSNLPTRISFRVPSLMDSRVILDQKGAESLLGMGDMLLLAPKRGLELERIQGAFVQDEDIREVVKFVSVQVPQEFDQQVIASADEEDDDDAPRGRKSSRSSSGADWTEEDADNYIDSGFEIDPLVSKYMQAGDDDLVRRALEVVLLEKKASTSYIQRRLKIGYNRAAELIDLMEERGIVGPPSGSGAKRDILVLDDLINQ